MEPEDLSRLVALAADHGAAALATGRAWAVHAAEIGGAWGLHVLALDLPVPDAALLAAFVLGFVALHLSLRGRALDARDEVETLYRAELLTANRRAQQAQGELRRARLEIERERQKRRREARASDQRTARVVALSGAKVRIAAGS